MDFSMIGQDMPGFPPLLRGTMPIENYRQRILIVVPSVFYFIASIFVVLRFYSRHIKGVGAKADDFLCLAALVLGYAQHSTLLTMVLGGGLGLDFMRIHISAMNVLFKATMANLVLYFANIAVLQFSILMLYRRIFGVNRVFRWVLYVGMGLVTVWGVSAVLTRILPCGTNIEAAVFMFGVTRPDLCVETDPICSGMGVSHVLLDFMILCLPIPIVWRLKTTVFNKSVITIVLLTGLVASVFGILRMQCLISLLSVGPENATVALWLSTLYQSLEVPIALICVCVPTMAPMWTQVSDSKVGSWAKRMLSTMTGSSSSRTGKSSQPYSSDSSRSNEARRYNNSMPNTERSLVESSFDEKSKASSEDVGRGINVQSNYTVEWHKSSRAV